MPAIPPPEHHRPCRATCVAARKMGLEAYVILRTDQSSTDPGMVGNLLPSRLAGAHIRLATHAGAQADLLQKLKAELQAEGKAPYVFPSGGSNSRGSWGYIQACH